MFTLNDDLSIYATRGDIVFFSVGAEEDGKPYKFQAGDVVRIKVFGKKDAENVVLQKDFAVTEITESVEIFLTEEDTKIGEVISKPKDYWYEVELNPYDNPQTIIGYDEDGAKVFKLFPEGDDVPEWTPAPEDIPVVDDELDMTSTRPVQNQAIARAFARLEDGYERTHAAVAKLYVTPQMFGAIGDGESDDYSAFNDMFKAVGASVVYDTEIFSNRILRMTVNIPAGVYRIKQANILADAFTSRSDGLVINGNGAIIFCEGFEGALLKNNDKLLNVDIYNLSFVSAKDDTAEGRIIVDSDSDGGAQGIRFHSCRFSGTWKYGINLTGSNTNSEWVFNECSFGGEWESFLYIGDTDTSDQFLNYWFNNCKYWCSSPWVTAYRGGHFMLNMCDISGYQPTKTTYLFNLCGNAHSSGVTTFADFGSRYELKSEHAKVIYCQWDTAHIVFNGVDMSSSSHILVDRADTFKLHNSGNGGASIYSFTDCKLMGRFRLSNGNQTTALNLNLKNCVLYGDATTEKVTDFFTKVPSDNAQAVFNVLLDNVKLKETEQIYNGSLEPWGVGQHYAAPVVAEVIRNPWSRTAGDWAFPVMGNTFIDEVIMVCGYAGGTGYTYKLSVVSDTGAAVSAINGSDLTMSVNNLMVGDKIYIGDSNEVYTVQNFTSDHFTLDKEIVGRVGDAVYLCLCESVFTENRGTRIFKSDKPTVVYNDLTIRNTGDTECPANGYGCQIVIKK